MGRIRTNAMPDGELSLIHIFDETFDDEMEGCQAFLSYLMEHLQ